jgi:hypothetical protein
VNTRHPSPERDEFILEMLTFVASMAALAAVFKFIYDLCKKNQKKGSSHAHMMATIREHRETSHTKSEITSRPKSVATTAQTSVENNSSFSFESSAKAPKGIPQKRTNTDYKKHLILYRIGSRKDAAKLKIQERQERKDRQLSRRAGN